GIGAHNMGQSTLSRLILDNLLGRFVGGARASEVPSNLPRMRFQALEAHYRFGPSVPSGLFFEVRHIDPAGTNTSYPGCPLRRDPERRRMWPAAIGALVSS